MNDQKPIEHDVVLVGGGHAHVEVLRQFAMRRQAGVRLTLVSRDIETPYSGMLPGFLAGHYVREDCHVDLVPLARAAGARLYQSGVSGLDLANRRVICSNRPSFAYDTLSIDIGSTPALDGIAGHQNALAIKPIHAFLERWDTVEPKLLNLEREIHITVIGGGAGGVEVSLCLHHRLSNTLKTRAISPQLKVHIVTDEPDILVGHSYGVRERLRRALTQRNIIVHARQPIDRIDRKTVHGPGNFSLDSDVVVIATHASAPDWLRQTGLSLDETGFIRVNERLQSISDPRVFAAGDIASFEPPLVKNGVYAVRQGPALADTLCDVLASKPPTVFSPQKRTLALISTGDKNAIASYGSISIEGEWIWRVKNWIDRRWMAKYAATAMEPMDDAAAMRCGGCGAKIPADILRDVLADFQNDTDTDVLIGLHNPDDAAVVRPQSGTVTVQTVDQFRSFIDDPYLFGRIASNHALSDIYAMGATPKTALATITLPHAKADKLAEDLRQLLAGARETLVDADVQLIGGHTGEGLELSFGLSVTGATDEDALLKKSGLRVGDALILTKSLGTGTLLSAWMQGKAKFDQLQTAIASMTASNRGAARVFLANEARACTDITGFGLIGHLGEMVDASKVHATIDLQNVPVLNGATSMLTAGIESTLQPGNLLTACRYVEDVASLDGAAILMDPQTSGGLLAGVALDRANATVAELKSSGATFAAVIGYVVDGVPGRISIRRE